MDAISRMHAFKIDKKDFNSRNFRRGMNHLVVLKRSFFDFFQSNRGKWLVRHGLSTKLATLAVLGVAGQIFAEMNSCS